MTVEGRYVEKGTMQTDFCVNSLVQRSLHLTDFGKDTALASQRLAVPNLIVPSVADLISKGLAVVYTRSKKASVAR